MPLIEEMESTGHWLFRWRSYLPIATIALVIAGLQHFVYPFDSHRWDEAWEMICLAISLLGLAIRVVTVGFAPRGTSGRNTKRQVADTLNMTGIYSVVRNPLYLGNFMVGLGESLFLRVWWIPVIYTLAFMLYYERIIFAEEMFLRQKFGELYMNWASRTPAFLPRFRQWKPPALTFNLRKVCRQEHQTLVIMVAVFYCLELAGDYELGHDLFDDTMWNAIAVVTALIFATIRVLRRFTSVFKDKEPEKANNRI